LKFYFFEIYLNGVNTPEGKRYLGRTRSSWLDKLNLRDYWRTLVNTVTNPWVE
jgi:hypothetical protein